MRTGNGGTQRSLVFSSNQEGREITSPEQVLSDTVKIRNCYVLVAEIRIKRSVVKIMHNSFVIFFEDLAR
jgi:CxxC motif-containing protein